MTKQKIEMAIKWLIYATFFVPLIVLPSSYIFPFIVPKIVFFRSIVEIMVFLYGLLLIINWQQYKPKLTYLNIAVLLFLISFGISTFSGTDAYHSFWDNHERMLGLLTVLHYVAFYFVLVGVLRDWNDWKWAGRVFLSAGFIVMFIAWLQTQSPELLLNRGSDRVASTLGNPIYVGGYGLFLLFLAFLLSSREKNTLWKWFYGIVGLFGFFAMFWSGTRGSMLGMVAGAAVAVIGYIVVLKKYPKIRYSLMGLAVLGVAAIALLYSFRQTNFVSNLPAVGRAVNTSLSDVKASPRWIAWEIAIRGWQERPLFGWGPNNYFYAFNEHYNPRSLDFGYGETWFDNAHNIILNTLTVQGAFGLIVFLGLYITAIVVLVRAYRKDKIDYHFMIIAGAFLVAHFVSVVTVFEDPTSYIYLMFWFAVVNVMTKEGFEKNNLLAKVSEVVNVSDKKVGNGMIATLAVACFIVVYIFNIQPASANQTTLNAIRAMSQDPTAGLVVAKEALAFTSPHIDDIRSDLARNASQSLSGSWEKLGKDKSNEIINVFAEALEKNVQLHPLDIRNQLSLAQLYQVQAMVNNNGYYLTKAESVLEDALAKSPRRQQIVYSLAGVKIQLNKGAESVQIMEQTLADNPRIAESYWRLAYSYKSAGQGAKIADVIQLAKNNNIKFTDQEQGIMDQLYPSTTVSNSKKK